MLLAAALSAASFSPARAMGEATTGTAWRPPAIPANDVVFDPVRQRLLALGSTRDAGELFALSLTPGATWTPIASAGSPPPAARERVLRYDPIQDRVVVQGGFAYETGCGCAGSCTWSTHLTGAGVWGLSLSGTPAWSPLGERALEGVPLVADPARGRLLLYGGAYYDCSVYDGIAQCDSSACSRDLWQLDGQTSTWSKVAENGPDLSCSNLVAALDPVRDRFLVMKASSPRTVWAFALGDASGWSQLATTGSQPSLKFDRAEYDPGTDALLLFSGDSLTALTLGATPAWQPIPTAGPGASVRGWDPVARKAWGYANGGPVYELDAAAGWTWTAIASPPPAPGMPGPRRDHAVAYDPTGERTFLMGGANEYLTGPSGCVETTGARADLWTIGEPDDGAQLVLPKPASGLLSQGAFDMGLVHDSSRNRLLLVAGRLFGGATGSWQLNLGLPTGWTPLVTDGGTPVARAIEVSAYDSFADRALLFGGPPGDALYAIDLGTDPPAWQHLPIAGEPATAIDFERSAWDAGRRRLWMLDVSTLQLSAIDVAGAAAWQAVPVAGTPPPAGACLLTYDPARDRLLVVRNGPAPFLWEIPLAAPAWVAVPVVGVPPSVQDGASFSFDPARDRALLFGGGNSLQQTGSGLYVLQFGIDSATAVAASLVAQDATPTRVRLEWQLVDAGGATFAVARSEDGTAWAPLASPRAGGQDRLIVEDDDVRAGARYGYRLAVSDRGVPRTLDEVWVQVPAGFTTRLDGARPNPSADPVRLSFALADDAPATLELLDVQGRQLARLDVGALGAGEHVVSLHDVRRLAPGLYFARLTRGGDVRVARLSVVR